MTLVKITLTECLAHSIELNILKTKNNITKIQSIQILMRTY